MNDSGMSAVRGEMLFPSEQELEVFANKFASDLHLPLVIWLQGDLGAGKTSFARALIHALGYKGRVKSPTYGLLEQYQIASLQILHMDLYRINDPGELEFLGLEVVIGFRNQTSYLNSAMHLKDAIYTGSLVPDLLERLNLRRNQLH